MSAIQVQFEHQLQEHLDARKLLYSKTSIFAKADKVVALLCLVFGIALVAIAGARWWTLIWFVVAPLEWFDVLSIEPLVVRYVFKRTPKFHEETTLTFDDEKILYKTPSIDSTLQWDMFKGFLENERLFLLLYSAPKSYAIIPKRAFGGDAHIEALRSLLTAKFPS